MSDEAPEEQIDHGETAKLPRFRISVAWILPIVAALAAGWMFWSQWSEEGHEIEIRFDNAPGLQVGKTPLVYRGVPSGSVTGIRLDQGLKQAVVTVRLKAFANNLAREGSQFWVERPTIGISQVTGLESIVEGNSIHVQLGDGPPARRFVGLAEPPVVEEYDPGLSVVLNAKNVLMIGRGASVYFRGARVGSVEETITQADGSPALRVTIEHAHVDSVRTSSRFWAIPAVSVRMGPGGISLDSKGLDILAQGGIAFDHFDRAGEAVDNGAPFELLATEALARASGEQIRIRFPDGNGLTAEETRVSYLGMPIGIVESVALDVAAGAVEASVRFEPGYEDLLKDSTAFVLVRPTISLNGISGLRTLITGTYIDCKPRPGGEPSRQFLGKSMSHDEWEEAEEQRSGLRLKLRPSEPTGVTQGAPVFFRGIAVGVVSDKRLDVNGRSLVEVVILDEFRDQVAANARFWSIAAASVTAGPGVLEVDIEGLQTLVRGGIAFEVFGEPEGEVTDDSEFELFPNERNARANSVPIEIVFEAGRGLIPGRTELRYLGLPVGLVERVEATDGKVQVTARLNSGYDRLRRKGSRFTVVEPTLATLQAYGLDAILGGVFIEVIPAPDGPLATRFTGGANVQPEPIVEAGFEIQLVSRKTRIQPDAPIFYRGLRVGRVSRKTLTPDGRGVVLTAEIDRTYTGLLREGTCFWDSSTVEAKFGWIPLRIPLDQVISAAGRISFATPEGEAMGEPVRGGHAFPLHETPERVWLRWNPAIPVENRP